MEIKTTCVLSQPITNGITIDAVTDLKVSDKYIAVALDNSGTHVFDLDGNKKHVLNSSHGAVWTIAIQGELLCVGGKDCLIRVWDLSTGKQTQVLSGHTSTIRALRFLNDGKSLVSGSADASIRIWDVETGRCKAVLNGQHTGTVRDIAISSSGNIFVSGSYDGTALVWSTENGDLFEPLHKLSGHEGQIYTVAITDDGNVAVTGGRDAVVRVWNTRTGQCLYELSGHTGLVTKIQIKGSTIITSDSMGSICAWSLMAPHNLIYKVELHENSVTSFDVNAEISLLASGSSDGSVKLSDVNTGQALGRLAEDAQAVWKVAFVDDRRVVSTVAREDRTMIEILEVLRQP